MIEKMRQEYETVPRCLIRDKVLKGQCMRTLAHDKDAVGNCRFSTQGKPLLYHVLLERKLDRLVAVLRQKLCIGFCWSSGVCVAWGYGHD